MDQDYIIRRREYVSKIRESFDTGNPPVSVGYRTDVTERQTGDNYLRFAGFRFLAAAMLFAAFILSAVTGMKIYTFSAEEIQSAVEKDYDLNELQTRMSELISSIEIRMPKETAAK